MALPSHIELVDELSFASVGQVVQQLVELAAPFEEGGTIPPCVTVEWLSFIYVARLFAGTEQLAELLLRPELLQRRGGWELLGLWLSSDPSSVAVHGQVAKVMNRGCLRDEAVARLWYALDSSRQLHADALAAAAADTTLSSSSASSSSSSSLASVSSSSSSSSSSFDVLAVDLLRSVPEQIARAMQLSREAALRSVTPIDLVDYVLKGENARIGHAARHFNALSLWLQTTVLLVKSSKKRAALVAKWIEVAAVAAVKGWLEIEALIGMTLSTVPLQRLKKTWQRLPPASARRLQEINEIIAPRGNFIQLRHLAAYFAVPLPLFVQTKDATFFWEKLKQMRPTDPDQPFNYSCFQEFAVRMIDNDLSRCYAVASSVEPVDAAYARFLADPRPRLTEDHLYDASYQAEPPNGVDKQPRVVNPLHQQAAAAASLQRSTQQQQQQPPPQPSPPPVERIRQSSSFTVDLCELGSSLDSIDFESSSDSEPTPLPSPRRLGVGLPLVIHPPPPPKSGSTLALTSASSSPVVIVVGGDAIIIPPANNSRASSPPSLSSPTSLSSTNSPPTICVSPPRDTSLENQIDTSTTLTATTSTSTSTATTATTSTSTQISEGSIAKSTLSSGGIESPVRLQIRTRSPVPGPSPETLASLERIANSRSLRRELKQKRRSFSPGVRDSLGSATTTMTTATAAAAPTERQWEALVDVLVNEMKGKIVRQLRKKRVAQQLQGVDVGQLNELLGSLCQQLTTQLEPVLLQCLANGVGRPCSKKASSTTALSGQVLSLDKSDGGEDEKIGLADVDKDLFMQAAFKAFLGDQGKLSWWYFHEKYALLQSCDPLIDHVQLCRSLWYDYLCALPRVERVSHHDIRPRPRFLELGASAVVVTVDDCLEALRPAHDDVIRDLSGWLRQFVVTRYYAEFRKQKSVRRISQRVSASKTLPHVSAAAAASTSHSLEQLQADQVLLAFYRTYLGTIDVLQYLDFFNAYTAFRSRPRADFRAEAAELHARYFGRHATWASVSEERIDQLMPPVDTALDHHDLVELLKPYASRTALLLEQTVLDFYRSTYFKNYLKRTLPPEK